MDHDENQTDPNPARKQFESFGDAVKNATTDAKDKA